MPTTVAMHAMPITKKSSAAADIRSTASANNHSSNGRTDNAIGGDDDDDDESEEEVTNEEFEIELDDHSAWAMNFYECAAEGDVAMLREILDSNKVSVDAVDVDGFTALMIAAAEGHRAIVMELLARGADVSVHTHELRSTALHFAAKNGDAEVVDAICKQDPRHVDAWNINNDTPLIWACIEGRAECVRVLLAHGADVNVVNQHGATTLICSVMLGEDPDEDESDDARATIIALLLATNPKLVNFQDREGSTAMHLAASCGYLACVKTLLAHGADVTLRNAIGQTPLEEAEETGLDESDKCVAFLQTIWQKLEEEAAARMMLMLEMEEQSARSRSTSATAKAVAAGAAGSGAAGTVGTAGSKKSKKKSKKLKRKAAKQQQQQQQTQSLEAGVAETQGLTDVDSQAVGATDAASSSESSDGGNGDDDDDHDTGATTMSSVGVTGGTEQRVDAEDDVAGLSGAWTTVGRKHHRATAAAATTTTPAAPAEDSETAPSADSATRRAVKAPTQKVVPFRRKLVKQQQPPLPPPSSSNSSSRAGALQPTATKAVAAPLLAQASTATPPARSAATSTSITSAAATTPSSTLFGSPFAVRARTHTGFPSSWRSSSVFGSNSNTNSTAGVTNGSSTASSRSLLWKHVHVPTTQRTAAEATREWLARLGGTNTATNDAFATLACGLCGDLATDNRQCSVSVNGSSCAQLYCSACLSKVSSASVVCVRCHQLMHRDDMRANALALAQTAALAPICNTSGGTNGSGSGGLTMADDAEARLTIDEMRVTLEHAVPRAAHVALHPFFLTPSSDLTVLSNGQLEVLEHAHQLALTQVLETRIANARAQERMQIEEWLKTQRDVLHYNTVVANAAAAHK